MKIKISDMVQHGHDKLKRLDHLSLNDLADYHEHQADVLRQEALKSQSQSERQASAINYSLKSERIVIRFLRQGHKLDDAFQKTAQQMNVPVSNVERSWERFLGSKHIYNMKRRNTLILELAALGLKNAQIGKKVSLQAQLEQVKASVLLDNARAEEVFAKTRKTEADIVKTLEESEQRSLENEAIKRSDMRDIHINI